MELSLDIKNRRIRYTKDDNDCWICTSHKPKTQRNGTKAYYSIRGFEGKVTMIHQMIYKHFNGEYNNTLCLRHKCDNALCINPNHLELGTHQDNMDDMNFRKKEHISSIRKGNNNANRKLCNDKVEEIRKKYKTGDFTQKELAEEYLVSRQLISKVVNYENWN